MTFFRSYIFWPLFFITQIIALALASWHLSAQFHFAYPLGYQLLGLEQHIAEFAPLNRFKEDFEFTNATEHWRLFSEISDAVQDSGRGLQNISYQLSNGQTTSLMHEAEIIHLQDVANLIDRFYATGSICFALWFLLIAFALWKKWLPPSNKKVLGGFLLGLTIITLAIVIIGAKDVFYWLHVQVFPEGHQWFFYYQDSLMTTLMKAPDIFAFISVFLLVILIVLWSLSLMSFKYAINHRLKK